MATNTNRKLTRCFCQAFEFGTFDPNTEQDDTYTTECTQSTHNTFAQGHDAKLVGFLVRAELGGDEISLTDGGVRIGLSGAVGAARKVSDALAAKTQAQLDAAKARLAKKASAAAAKQAKRSGTKAAKAEAPAPVKPTSREARIKVGRWTYDAVIDAMGQATYSTKLGGTKTTTVFQEV